MMMLRRLLFVVVVVDVVVFFVCFLRLLRRKIDEVLAPSFRAFRASIVRGVVRMDHWRNLMSSREYGRLRFEFGMIEQSRDVR